MTTNNFCFYLQNRLIQTGQTGGQQYSDTPPSSIPWFSLHHFKAGHKYFPFNKMTQLITMQISLTFPSFGRLCLFSGTTFKRMTPSVMTVDAIEPAHSHLK